MSRILLLNKPFDVLCQFTDAAGRRTLASYVPIPGVYAAGRLDRDSEGLVVLTDDGHLQHRISHPKFGKRKGYWVQVEGAPSEANLEPLRRGVRLREGLTAPAEVHVLPEAPVGPRDPPVRFRKTVPDTWIELWLTEGMNRQVRRMTAAVGFPTLRLVRFAVGPWQLDDLPPGAWRDAQAPVEPFRSPASG